MDDESVNTFVMITGQTEAVARRYLEMTENDGEAAITLFFDSPDLATGLNQSAPPAVHTSSRPQGSSANPAGVVNLDGDEDEDLGDFDDDHAAAVGRSAEYDEDEAMARRMQEELFAGGDSAGGYDADGIRAPIARTTETLVGGPGGGWGHEDMEAAIAEQMQMRQNRAAARPGVFNQRPVPSIWDERADPATRQQGLAQATGGASTASAKSAKLAELYRPPFEIMNQIPWDAAREKGKDEEKWILVNIQDPSIFDCQSLNRDIWKDQGIKEVVKENFVFMQFTKDDPRGQTYIQYYFQQKDNEDAYPHIAIVDPRTGEQVKVWSGPPVPKAPDFLMQLIEFLDRYSLDLSKKNPVAKRKPEKPTAVDVDRLTEEEMLDLAMQNSLAAGSTSRPKAEDPDELTKSFGDIGKGKGKEVEDDTMMDDTNGHEEAEATSPTTYSRISSSKPHTEPAPGPGVARIQVRHPNGRIVRRFNINDPVERIYEWLKAEPLGGKAGIAFEVRSMPEGKDLGGQLKDTIESAGLGGGTVMVEFLEE